MEAQRPCSIEYLKNRIREIESKLKYGSKLLNSDSELAILLNVKDKQEKHKKDLEILYDYAFLRFGINLKLTDW